MKGCHMGSYHMLGYRMFTVWLENGSKNDLNFNEAVNYLNIAGHRVVMKAFFYFVKHTLKEYKDFNVT